MKNDRAAAELRFEHARELVRRLVGTVRMAVSGALIFRYLVGSPKPIRPPLSLGNGGYLELFDRSSRAP